MAADKRANSKAFSTAETVASRYQTLSEWMDGARRSVRPNGRRPHSLFGHCGLTQPGTCFLRWRAVSSSKYSVRRPSGLRERGVKTKLMQLSSYLPRTEDGRADPDADVGAADNCSRRDDGRTKTSRVPVAVRLVFVSSFLIFLAATLLEPRCQMIQWTRKSRWKCERFFG